jgi:hypothetical protein
MSDKITFFLYEELSLEILEAFTEHLPSDCKPYEISTTTDKEGKIILIGFLMSINKEILMENNHILYFDSELIPEAKSSSGRHFGFIIRIPTRVVTISTYPYPGSPLPVKRATFENSREILPDEGWNAFFITRITPEKFSHSISIGNNEKKQDETQVVFDASDNRNQELNN